MGYITSIGTATPAHKLPQHDIAEFMVGKMELNNDDARRLRTVFRQSGIQYRHSVIPDYGGNVKDFFSKEDTFPSTRERLDLFKRHALALSIAAIEDCISNDRSVLKRVSHLIVVSCTGMYAPGLDIELVHALGLSQSVNRTCINFMGCYAAFNAIKIANAYCQSGAEQVLIVCTELCSIHFQKDPSPDNILANALFADGAAALLMQPEKAETSLETIAFHQDLAPSGKKDMAWNIGDFGFEMKLSSYIPEIIENGIHELTTTLISRIGGTLNDISYFAIHPGGRKILEAIEKALNIPKEKNEFAYQVLAAYGNMSSPTVLFVLKRLTDSLSSKDTNKMILSFAFGPGLTLESMLLKIRHSG